MAVVVLRRPRRVAPLRGATKWRSSLISLLSASDVGEEEFNRAATRWNRVALASSVSLVKLVSVRPSGGVDILDKAGTGPEDVPEGQAVAAELGGYGRRY